MRHPIYGAIAVFVTAGVVAHGPRIAALWLLLLLCGIGVRMYAEETTLRRRYPGYARYISRTKRLIPRVF